MVDGHYPLVAEPRTCPLLSRLLDGIIGWQGTAGIIEEQTFPEETPPAFTT